MRKGNLTITFLRKFWRYCKSLNTTQPFYSVLKYIFVVNDIFFDIELFRGILVTLLGHGIVSFSVGMFCYLSL